MSEMASVDLIVTWLRPDGSTIDLPACVCFSASDMDGELTELERRTISVSSAVEMTMADAPDELPEGSLPTRWTVMAGFRAEVRT